MRAAILRVTCVVLALAAPIVVPVVYLWIVAPEILVSARGVYAALWETFKRGESI